jgi:predicted MFS family arabinose efflux permease
MAASCRTLSHARIYWTAFVGLFFDYYDLYLFIYLDRVLAGEFSLTQAASNGLQFVGLAGVGIGALGLGLLADRWGRGRAMLVVFGVYGLGIAGLSLAWNLPSLMGFRLLASLALGAEWGVSHTFLAERVDRGTRYRFAALLQFAILGGLLAALAKTLLLPQLGWRGLFAVSLAPIALLSLLRWRALVEEPANVDSTAKGAPRPEHASSTFGTRLLMALNHNARPFAICLGLASLTIASGTINVFYVKDLPQGIVYTVLFWLDVAPGMLLGAWIVRRAGVGRALAIYALALMALSVWAWHSNWPSRALAFALVLPMLNGIPLGLMGAFFNEVFGEYRTMLSGAAYNLGRIAAGFSPILVTSLGLRDSGRYFVFSALLGAGVLILSAAARRLQIRL